MNRELIQVKVGPTHFDEHYLLIWNWNHGCWIRIDLPLAKRKNYA